jgi:DNA polymerase/3'-5' exonuclease PolX
VSFKKDIKLETASKIARDFVQKTKDLYKRYEIAGSIRRKQPIVHDIDLAVIPSIEDRNVWKEELRQRANEIGGKMISSGDVISNIRYRDVQVNLFLGNELGWGATLMWATGPKGHTIGMNIKARSKNLVFNSNGIWTRDEPPKFVGGRTEEEIASILDWEYKPPEIRGREAADKGMFY